MAVDPNELLVFKLRKQPQGEKTTDSARATAKTTAQNVVEAPPAKAQPEEQTLRKLLTPETPAKAPPKGPIIPANVVTKGKPILDKGARSMARGLKCFWHPWRAAYAVCSQCRRPFCFADLITYKGQYLCFEDISLATPDYQEILTSQYTSMTNLSSLCFLAVFFIFIFFAHGQIMYLVEHLAGSAPGQFLLSNLLVNLTLVAEITLTTISLLLIIGILTHSNKAYILSSVVGLMVGAIFCYAYINSPPTLYLLVVTIISFLGVITLSLSRTTYLAEARLIDYWQSQAEPSKTWVNAGVF